MGANPFALLRRLTLVPGLAPVRRALGVLVVLGVGTGAVAIAQAVVVAWLLSAVVTGGNLAAPAITLASLIAARGLLALAAEPVGQWAGHRVSGALRLAAIQRWLSSPIERRPPADEALTLATEGASATEPYIARFVPALVAAAVVPLLTIATLAFVDLWSALIVVLTLPLLPFFAALIGRHTQAETERKWSTLGTLSAHFLDVVKGLPTLVNYGRAERQVDQVAAVGARYRRTTGQALRTAFLSTTALELLATISVALVAVMIGLRLAGGSVALQVGLTAILLAPEAYWPIRRLGAEFHNAVDGQRALDSLLPTAPPTSPLDRTRGRQTIDPTEHVVANESPRLSRHACDNSAEQRRTRRETTGLSQHACDNGAEQRRARKGAPRDWAEGVRLDGVGYRYTGMESSERVVLDDLWLQAPNEPGLTVLTGPSGSGKTTVLDIIAGIREPTSGRVDTSAHLQYAPQRPLIVPGTVADNLRLAAPGASPGAMGSALHKVGLWEALAEREGLATRLGDDGFGLSAGQRARLSLARMLLSNARAILLDEPTAHVAAASRPDLLDALVECARTSRVIVATHDPDLMRLADQHWRLPAPQSSPEAPRSSIATSPGSFNDPRPSAAERPTQQPVHHRPAGRRPEPEDHAEPHVERDPPDSPPDPGHLSRTARGRMLLACFLGGMALACGVALTATSGWLIVRASEQPVILTLLVAVVGVRAFGVGRPLFRYAERVVSHDWALASLTRRRVEVFRGLIPLTPARLGARQRGDLLTAIVRDLDDAVFASVRVTVPAVGAAFATVIAAGILLLYLPLAAAVILAGGLLVAVVGLVVAAGERAAGVSEVAARASLRRRVGTLVSTIDGHRAVLGHRAAPDPLAMHAHEEAPEVLAPIRRLTEAQRGASVRAAWWRGAGLASAWFLVAIAQVMVAGLAAAAYADGRLAAPLAALVALAPMAMAEVWVTVPEIGGNWARARAATERLKVILSQSPAVVEATASARISPPADSTTALSDVDARWQHDGPLALAGLNLEAGSGDRIVLTGPNGSGKSTAFAVIARHLDHAGGRYALGGTPVERLGIDDVRRRIAIADDDPHLFAGSLRANLALAAGPDNDDAGARDHTSEGELLDQRLIDGLYRAGLGGWFAGLPDGLDTEIRGAGSDLTGANGVSGGERTRLALARALISERPILLLDEPTAHLDHPTAKAVVDDLTRASADRAVVLVSHDRFGIDPGAWDEVSLTQHGSTSVRDRAPAGH